MPTLDKKNAKNQASKGAEEILLTQIKQEFTTPAEAIFDYLELIEKNLDLLNLSGHGSNTRACTVVCLKYFF